ncbi:unnamed protein product, partial [Didymodactylos carnosus]
NQMGTTEFETLLQLFRSASTMNQNSAKISSEAADGIQKDWMNNSFFYRQIGQGLSADLDLTTSDDFIMPTPEEAPTDSIIQPSPQKLDVKKQVTKTSLVENNNKRKQPLDEEINKTAESSFDENVNQSPTKARQIRLYTSIQYRTINKYYPFKIQFFTDQISSLDLEQHKMGLKVFYDQNGLVEDIEAKMKKKTEFAKAIKRMNGLLLNEHRLFNENAKDYAMNKAKLDYDYQKYSIMRYMQHWLEKKITRLKSYPQYYQEFMKIPLNSYELMNPVNFAFISILRVGTLPLLFVPEILNETFFKCSDDRDKMVSKRFLSTDTPTRLTSLMDDPNILLILAQKHVDIVLSKSSFQALIELFSTTDMKSIQNSSSLLFKIREFQLKSDTDLQSTTTNKHKVLFFEKPLPEKSYSKRQLNMKYFKRSFRSFLMGTTQDKQQHFIPFEYITTPMKEHQLTEFKIPAEPKIVNLPQKLNLDEEIEEEKEELIPENDEEEDEPTLLISTDGDVEQQQKEFKKEKQRIIKSIPVLSTEYEQQRQETGPVPVTTTVRLTVPQSLNYEYSLWQMGNLTLLIRTTYHGYLKNDQEQQCQTCIPKLEYQPQFGYEQITDQEYRKLWTESYLRNGCHILLGRINVFTEQLLKIEKFSYLDIEKHLKECDIDMLKPLKMIYSLLYGLYSLEPNSYILSCPWNESQIYLYNATKKSTSDDSTLLDLYLSPETNSLLIENNPSKQISWQPLTPTLLMPYHRKFNRIPLTFTPRHRRLYDIDFEAIHQQQTHRRFGTKSKRLANTTNNKIKSVIQKKKRVNMDDYSTKIRIEAERLIKTEFPVKALELDALVSSQSLSFSEVPKVRHEARFPTVDELVTHFLQKNTNTTNNNNSDVIEDRKHKNVKKRKINDDQSPISFSSKEIGTSVFLFPCGLIPSNGIIQLLEDKLKPYIFHFLDSIAIIKLWIQLLIPKVEDGNNFGVSIQEDSLTEIRTLETDVTQYLDLTYKYLVSRGELVKKVAKYPHVEDYRRSVQSLDEKQFVSMRFIALELRNHYVRP